MATKRKNEPTKRTMVQRRTQKGAPPRTPERTKTINMTGYILTPWNTALDADKTYEVQNVRMPAAYAAKSPSGNSCPPEGLTLFYGFNTTLASMSLARRWAAEQRLVLHSVRVEAAVPDCPPSGLTPDQMAAGKSLAIGQTDKALMILIMEKWFSFLIDEGEQPPQKWLDGKMSIPDMLAYIRERPDLIGRLREAKDFRHLAVITYPINEEGKQSQRGTLFDAGVVQKVTAPEAPDVTIVLPKRIGKIRPQADSAI